LTANVASSCIENQSTRAAPARLKLLRSACDDARVTALLVTLAGGGGVLLRYGISSAVHGDALPWTTAAINVAGSFLLGMLVVAHWASPQVRATLGVGFLGGFTTFSTWSVQAFLDAEAGEPVRGLVLVLLSVLLGVGAAAAGYYAGRAVW
jgi:fluoride exporter